MFCQQFAVKINSMVQIGNEWDALLKSEFESDYYAQLRQFLKKEYSSHTVYPPMWDIFNALKLTSYSDVRVVILGQDPYHGEGQAHGLCFSVKRGVKPPPSLINIYKEMNDDIGIPPAPHGELTLWAKNGVLLLNTVLTVREGQAASHRGKGWEILTDKIITLLGQRDDPIVFMLWGRPAREKAKLISGTHHLILECAHPSPLSAYNGFFGCKHFSKANEFLQQHGHSVNWSIE